MLDHLEVGMPQPLLDFALGCAAEKGLAAEVMPKAMQPAMLEADLTLGSGKFGFERLNNIVDEHLQNVPRA